MSEINFCSKCGTEVKSAGNFCVACGSQLGVESTSALKDPQVNSTSNVSNSISVTAWIGVAFAFIIGIPSFQSAVGMPSQAEYVTFNFTFNNLINGGWYTWYSGSSALVARLADASGMEASTLRLILWFITGFSFSLAAPALKLWIRRFVKDVTN